MYVIKMWLILDPLTSRTPFVMGLEDLNWWFFLHPTCHAKLFFSDHSLSWNTFCTASSFPLIIQNPFLPGTPPDFWKWHCQQIYIVQKWLILHHFTSHTHFVMWLTILSSLNVVSFFQQTRCSRGCSINSLVTD